MLPFSFTGNAGSTLSHIVVPAGGRDRIRLQYVNTTKEANAPTVFAVHEGPALVELDGTSACRINLVAGEYF